MLPPFLLHFKSQILKFVSSFNSYLYRTPQNTIAHERENDTTSDDDQTSIADDAHEKDSEHKIEAFNPSQTQVAWQSFEETKSHDSSWQPFDGPSQSNPILTPTQYILTVTDTLSALFRNTELVRTQVKGTVAIRAWTDFPGGDNSKTSTLYKTKRE